jgi:lipopolysaccharide transport system permease protein
MEKFITHIKPASGFSLGFKELWQYRELFYFFSWRDIKGKYKQATLGILWALLQPLGLMVIFTFLFSKTWPINTGDIQYPVFVLTGLIAWNFFSHAVANGSESIIRQEKIINKIYFPRLIIPGAAVLVAFFDFIMGLIIFIIFCTIYKQPVQLSALLYYPIAIALLLITAFGFSSFLSALTVKYRDFRYTIPFLLQVLFFASQVIYPLQSVQQQWVKYVLALNPVNAAIELFRAPLSANNNPDWAIVGIGAITAVLIFVIGIYIFKKTEAYFADLI